MMITLTARNFWCVFGSKINVFIALYRFTSFSGCCACNFVRLIAIYYHGSFDDANLYRNQLSVDFLCCSNIRFQVILNSMSFYRDRTTQRAVLRLNSFHFVSSTLNSLHIFSLFAIAYYLLCRQKQKVPVIQLPSYTYDYNFIRAVGCRTNYN